MGRLKAPSITWNGKVIDAWRTGENLGGEGSGRGLIKSLCRKLSVDVGKELKILSRDKRYSGLTSKRRTPNISLERYQ
jgi:hypothetical protein